MQHELKYIGSVIKQKSNYSGYLQILDLICNYMGVNNTKLATKHLKYVLKIFVFVLLYPIFVSCKHNSTLKQDSKEYKRGKIMNNEEYREQWKSNSKHIPRIT